MRGETVSRAARRRAGEARPSLRRVEYRRLRHPFAPQPAFSEDRIAAIHETALRVLEELGMRVLLPEARAVYAAAGCLVDEESRMVRIGREIVAAALAAAPRRFTVRAANPERDVAVGPGTLWFKAAGGCPNATDLVRGRRPGRLADAEDLIRLSQAFDVIHMIGPCVEPQDVAPHLRHYASMRAQVTLADKPGYVYARGRRQVADSFEILQTALGLGREEFEAEPHCYTVINTNSPRQLDVSMAEGILDFARAGQLLIITPFCLAGAMAPVTVAGALVLQHAEALAGITLAELARPGAPVLYGSFLSNVDLRSGAPAFGTPEHVRATLASGQLARLIGLPWRSGAGSASNAADAQAVQENLMGLWASMLGNATNIIHAAGWIEGGLSVSYEKFILDIEALQVLAELCTPAPADEDALAFAAIAEVPPGGHFFGARHTMARYETAFYAPLVADLSNFGQWREAGGRSATERATGIWQRVLRDVVAPPLDSARLEAIDAFIARRTAAGGAPPVS